MSGTIQASSASRFLKRGVILGTPGNDVGSIKGAWSPLQGVHVFFVGDISEPKKIQIIFADPQNVFSSCNLASLQANMNSSEAQNKTSKSKNSGAWTTLPKLNPNNLQHLKLKTKPSENV